MEQNRKANDKKADPFQPGNINHKEKGLYSLPTELLYDIADMLQINALGNFSDAACDNDSINEYSRNKIADLYVKRIRNIDFLLIYSCLTMKQIFVTEYLQSVRCDRRMAKKSKKFVFINQHD